MVKSNSKAIFILVIAIFLFSAFIIPDLAAGYTPGVKTGDYVKYGNYWGIGDTAFIASIREMDWLSYSVVTVNGAEVTIASAGALKNGTATGGGTATYNIEMGTMSTKYASNTTYTNGPIIPPNLNEGDVIPPGYSKVNKTITMNYLGVNRLVNIINGTSQTPEVTINSGYIYDQKSGMLLEMQVEDNQTQPIHVYTKYGCSVIETNLFQPEPTPSPTIPLQSPTPTADPTSTPTPTINPTTYPTSNPTTSPTQKPTSNPTDIPEFPSIAVLLLLVFIPLVVAAILRKKG